MNAQTDGGFKKSERFFAAFVFLVIGSIIITVFSPWRPLMEGRGDYIGRFLLIFLLSLATIVSFRAVPARPYRPILSGLLALAVAVSLDYILSSYVIRVLHVTDTTPADWALQKFNEFLIVVSTILFMNWAFRGSLKDLYIRRGRLKNGLTVGFVALAGAAALSIPMAQLFNARDLTIARILPWTPWILVFVLCNGAMEEIMFRGLFLKKLQPFVGRLGANVTVAVVFSLIHGTVKYSADNYLFVVITFFLALAWGDVMQRNENVWGSILFHAGMDIPIALGIFSNLG